MFFKCKTNCDSDYKLEFMKNVLKDQANKWNDRIPINDFESQMKYAALVCLKAAHEELKYAEELLKEALKHLDVGYEKAKEISKIK